MGERGDIRSYHDLEVWRRSRRLVKTIYMLTKSFPRDEIFGLTQQMRRSAVSIPLNIAEGYSRHGIRDYINFISIAIGSAAELETQLLIAQDLEYLSEDQITAPLQEVSVIHKMLYKLRQALQTKL